MHSPPTEALLCSEASSHGSRLKSGISHHLHEHASCRLMPDACLQGSLLKILVLQQLHLLGDPARNGEIKSFAKGMADKLQASAAAFAATGLFLH